MTLFPSRPAQLTILAAVLLMSGFATGCGSIGAASVSPQPYEPTWKSERERELDHIKSRPFFLAIHDTIHTRITWVFDDIADMISGAPSRYGRNLADKENPDNRRDGIMGLVARPWGETPVYTKAYAEISGDSSQDSLVRATALRALNRSRVRQYTPLYITQLTDPSPLVRLEACKALNRMPDVNAVPQLMKMIGRIEEDKDVRIAATEALRHYKQLEVARALVKLLNERDFGIAWQARRGLTDITQKNFGYDEAAWLNYLTGPEKPLG
jgi:hypothetical protein